ncbi:hypothetical protein [Allomuricauda sp. NBRC 101325]|uniref:hypothetical protein n=1 Tax=Allomuricauda sp. NBRC 101325 TaxID=1113758 RepID=UPI0024A2F941|nr:hypothetical protein [Muricauda sp. NBRC 101325]GLU43758.1 hypothetical protein Musp01_13820 [Muricauda sp. NBRC 101325]
MINNTTYFITILFLSLNISCVGQEKLIKHIERFIPKSTIASETRVYSGNLNHDEFEDIVLRFKIENEPEEREHFHLLLGQKNGTYKLSSKNDFFTEDGVDGTAFNGVVIKNGYFSIEYGGGGNTSGSYDIITFKYSKENDNWLLHRVGSLFMHRYADTEPTEEISTQKDFGEIAFKDYGIDNRTLQEVEIDFSLTEKKEIVLDIKNNLYEPIIINSFIFSIPSLILTIKDKNDNIIAMPPPPIPPDDIEFHEKIIKGRESLEILIGAISEILDKVPKNDIQIRGKGFYKTLEEKNKKYKMTSEWVIIEKHNLIYQPE